MTIERDPDPESTVKMPRLPPVNEDEEEFDPEKTLVREDWESTVIRRLAPRIAAVRSVVEEDEDQPFGWESEGLRRLSRELRRSQD